MSQQALPRGRVVSSTTHPGLRASTAFGGRFASMAEFAATDASSTGPGAGRVVAADAAGERDAGKGDIPC